MVHFTNRGRNQGSLQRSGHFPEGLGISLCFRAANHARNAFGERGLVLLVKRRGFGERLHVDLEDGWGDLTTVMAADPFEVRAAQLF